MLAAQREMVKGAWNRLVDGILGCLSVAWVLRVQSTIALLTFFLLAVPRQLVSEQLYESLQSTAERGAVSWSSIALCLSTALFSLTLLDTCRMTLDSRPIPNWGHSAVRDASALYLPVLLPVVPWGALAAACWWAAARGEGHDSASLVLRLLGILLILSGLVTAALAVRGIGKPDNEPHRRAGRTLTLGLVLWAGIIVVASTSLVQKSVAIGAVPVLILALSGWSAVGTAAVLAGGKVRLPLILFSAIAAIFFGSFNLNDNHKVRVSSPTVFPNLPTTYEIDGRVLHPELGALDGWLKSRRDLEAYAGQSYPIAIVSTEGGGLRAAYLTAQVLASIQDRCPGFAEHIYAISAVSGGSLGAAVFAALARQSPRHSGGAPCDSAQPRRHAYQDKVDSILQRDLLTPVTVRLLFTDLLQRFLPVEVQEFDRGVALEEGFERAWAEGVGSDEFGDDFNALWADSARPAPPLILNTTLVESGDRVVITPLYTASTLVRMTAPIRLSTAVSLSARFPYVTPAGWIDYELSGIRRQSGVSNLWNSDTLASGRLRFVDGGYYDNSGAASLLNLVNVIQRRKDARRGAAAKIPSHHFIVIRISTLNIAEAFPGQSLGEILSPPRVLLNTRNARAADAMDDLRYIADQLRDTMARLPNYPNDFILCHDPANPVPLGWILSDRARGEIRSQVDSTVRCAIPWTGGVDSVSNRLQRDQLVGRLMPGQPQVPPKISTPRVKRP